MIPSNPAPSDPSNGDAAVVDLVLGYLNYSTGAFDAQFFQNLNLLFRFCDPASADDRSSAVTSTAAKTGKPVSTETSSGSAGGSIGAIAKAVRQILIDRLCELETGNAAFRDPWQAKFTIEAVFDYLLPRYLKFHEDVLFDVPGEFLFNSFFVARAFEIVLKKIQAQGWDNADVGDGIDLKILARQLLEQLNDFVGHRPAATLESRKCQPYPHEYFRPIPVYVQGAGVAWGRYHDLLTAALKLIRETDSHILRAAHFSCDRLVELAIDPRAYDFDHPINQRPNHHFGQWDDDTIGEDGFFSRFVLHAVTLDALLDRVETCTDGDCAIDYDEAMLEASSALACTMLMGSGISGSEPGSYDSNTTLGTLIPVIAGYRDQFYQDLLKKLNGQHQVRLLDEAQSRHQPFGGVRQDLNARLARHRAKQLVNCRLASIFARMGYPEAATKQSKIVPVASARILCQIDCMLASANDGVDKGELQSAFATVHRILSRLKAGISCGAIVDPWNIIGFDANYSLFPAMENTVRDHRVYDLIDIMDRLFGLLSRITSESAASDNDSIREDAENEMRRIVDWWRKYAVHEVSSVAAVDPEDLFEAASTVSQALSLWHKGGAAAGAVEFWAPHAEIFDSPKAYSLVIDALMQRQDYKTCSALLVHWISQSDIVPLEHGDSSFHNLMFRWIAEQKTMLTGVGAEERDRIWQRIRKYHDFLEVNSGEYWDVPEFSLAPNNFQNGGQRRNEDPSFYDEFDELIDDDDDDADDGGDSLYRAAYDDVVFTDSTDDGMDGEVHDGGVTNGDDSLEAEVDRVLDRQEFLGTLASFWCVAAKVPLPTVSVDEIDDAMRASLVGRRDFVFGWIRRATQNRQHLLALLESVDRYQIKVLGSDRESMVQYDQQRLNKDLLLEHTINTCIETDNAIRLMAGVVQAIDFLVDGLPLNQAPKADATDRSKLHEMVGGAMPMVNVFAALVLRDGQQVLEHFDELTNYLEPLTTLYVPLSKGGKPARIVNARVLQSGVLDLLRQLPSLGLFAETHRLTRTALEMERNNPVGGGAVTEFDGIFEVAYTSKVEALVKSTAQLKQNRLDQPNADEKDAKNESQTLLFECIKQLTESMLPMWLDHSKTLRLSVLEKVRKQPRWDELVDFIRTYGHGLFTQSFFHLGNIRAILHQGVDNWLRQFEESSTAPDLRLFDELGAQLPRETAVRNLTLVLESVRENFNEYVDYNTTTTQSDRGDSLDSFLDFLRLRSRYDRVCWHLKPVVWAHRILVRRQSNAVARMWRRSLNERVGSEADRYLQLLQELRDQYSIQLNSVGRRLEGRFAHQLQIDRLRALVAPAMERPRSRESDKAFELLQHESQAFLRSTNGVGVDLPEWLAELENEVQQYLLPRRLRDFWHEPSVFETPPIPIDELKEKIEQLRRQVE